MTRKKMFYVFAVCLALPLLTVATYEFKTINPFSSVETSARGINDKGDVVGDFATAAQFLVNSESGFLRHDGKYKKIEFPGAVDTDANGINNHGDIVGTYDVPGGDHGYVFHNGKYIALPDPPNGSGADFNAINDEGDIVGVFGTQKQIQKGGAPIVITVNEGFVIEDGTYTVIDCGHGLTEANGINNDGDIVGECTDSSSTGQEHGFLLRDGKFHLIDFPGALGTVALGINEQGDIAGMYTDSTGDHGFVLKGFPEEPKWKTVDAPGAASTKVAGINEHDELVGTSTTTGQDKGFKAEKQ